MASEDMKPRFPYASRIDDDGRLLIPPAVRDLAGLKAGMDVTLSEGRDGFVVILPVTLTTAGDIASTPPGPPPTLLEGSKDRIAHLVAHVDEDQGDGGGIDRLILSLGTSHEELASTLGCGAEGEGGGLADSTFRDRLRFCLTIIGMHDTYIHEGPRPPLAGDGELIQSYAWYRTAKLSGCGGRTPAALVREDRGDAVIGYLEAGAAGVYA